MATTDDQTAINQEKIAAFDEDFKSVEQNDRLNFIRKVFGILSVQLALTAGMVGMVKSNEEWNRNVYWNGAGWCWACFTFAIISELMILCNRKLARKVPINYVLLLVFTLSFAYIVTFICTGYPTEVVVAATAMTAGITLALTVYALTTKKDFTYMGGMLWVMGMTIFMTAMFGFWFYYSEVYNLLLCSLCVILYGLYLIYDVQLVAGGGRHKLDMDDYIIGALIIYIDIINLFLTILRMLGSRR